MDKLKVVLQYKFWILLGTAVLVPLVGWSIARSSQMDEAKQREKTLQDLKDNLAKTTVSNPNTEWENRVKEQTRRQEIERYRAWNTLYERQRELMTWPSRVNPAKVLDERGGIRDRGVYRTSYADERNLVIDIVEPTDRGGKVGIIRIGFPDAPKWESGDPPGDEVIAAQEDLWLMRALLECIAKVNAGAASQLDAPIKAIFTFVLRGGSEGAAAPADGRGAQDNESIGGPMMMAGGGAAAPQESKFSAVSSFDPTDEFGPETPKEIAGAEPGAVVTSEGGFTAQNLIQMAREMSGGTGGGKAPVNNNAMERYIQKKPEWKTRGFYLDVAMDHRRVADLLVALSNARWPARIARVQQADYADETLKEAISPTAPKAGPYMIAPQPDFVETTPGPDYLGSTGPILSIDAGKDPNLANVSISGWFIIINPPTQSPAMDASEMAADETSSQAQPGSEPVPAAETSAPGDDQPAKDQPAPANEPPAAERDALENGKDDKDN